MEVSMSETEINIQNWLVRVEKTHPCQICGKIAPAFEGVLLDRIIKDEIEEDKYAQCKATCGNCKTTSIFTLILKD